MADIINFLSNATVLTMLLVYIFTIWIGLVIWTWVDISRRTDNYLYRLMMLVLVAFGAFVGFAFYLMIRPTLTKKELAAQNLEEQFLLASAAYLSCPNCSEPAAAEFSFCVKCGTALKRNCPNCNYRLNSTWLACPSCGTMTVEEALPAAVSVVESTKAAGKRRLPLSMPSIPFDFVAPTLALIKRVLPARVEIRGANGHSRKKLAKEGKNVSKKGKSKAVSLKKASIPQANT